MAPSGGVFALVDWLRSVPDRLRRPETLLMMMAVLASLGAHMPPYLSLGALADYFKTHPPIKSGAAPVEVSFEVDAPSDPKPDDPLPEEPEKLKREKAAPDPAKKAKLEPEKKAELDEPKPEVSVTQVPVPPPPPEQERKQSITQKSEDPNVEPPPDAKFLAEESRRVEEETLAVLRDQNRDDPTPQPSAPQGQGPEESGDATKEQRGELGGASEPAPRTPAVAMREPSQARPAQEATQRPPTPRAVPQPKQAPAPAIAPGTIIRDPLGSFVMAAAPAQRTASSQRPRDPATTEGASGAQPNLKVSWRAFEETFGAEQLAKDRMPPGAKRRGAGREKRWSEFRAAIENYVTGIKPGNTTALNAASDPFAAYLAAFHRNLHIEFAHDFLGSLPTFGALGNPNLVTKVEIVVNPDGTLDRVGIVKTSGDTMYDFGAFNAVQRGAPYPPPPEKIRSPDGRTYIQWALHRNESQCGTWNADPFMVRDPPRSPNDPPQDSVPPFRKRLLPNNNDGEHGRAPHRAPKHERSAGLFGDAKVRLGRLPAAREQGHRLFVRHGARDDDVFAVLPVDGRGDLVPSRHLHGVEGAQDLVEVATRGHRVRHHQLDLLVGANDEDGAHSGIRGCGSAFGRARFLRG